MATFGSSITSPVISFDALGNLVGATEMAIINTSPSGVTPGTYGDASHAVQFTVNTYGDLTAAANVAIQLDASAVISGTLSALRLPSSGVTAASYGDATHVATLTVDATGRLTAAASVAITGVAPGGAAGGDLTGTYPNPTVGNTILAAYRDQVYAADKIAYATSSNSLAIASFTSVGRSVVGAATLPAFWTVVGVTVAIAGGTIDGTTVGGTTRAAGSFTTIGIGKTATATALDLSTTGNNGAVIKSDLRQLYVGCTGGSPAVGTLSNDLLNIITNGATSMTVAASGDVAISVGNLSVTTAGKGLQVKEGSNARMGTAVLVGGTVTVSNTSVTASTRIFLTSNTDGGTPGWLRVSARVASTSFTITSSSGTDTSTVAFLLCEPA